MRRAAIVAFVFFTAAVALTVAAPVARAATTFATQQTVLGTPAGQANPAPLGLATDAAGDVFMADGANNQVLELTAGSTTPTVLPFTGLSYPSAVAADPNGDVFVLSSNTVIELPAGSTTQVVLPFSGLDGPTSMAVDSAGDVYVTDPSVGSGEVVELPAGSSTSEVLPLSGISYPQGVAVDSSGDLYLYGYDSTYGPSIEEFTPGATAGTVLPFTGLVNPSAPQYLAVDSTGDVYVSQHLGGTHADVLELPAGSQSATTVPLGTLAEPTGVAVDGSGDLFVSDAYQVLELAAGAASPTVTALIPLANPEGVAVDSLGDLFVADTNDNRVLELQEGSTTAITLPFTGLYQPTDVGVDAAGDVFVVNELYNSSGHYVSGDEVVELPAGSSTQVTLQFGTLDGHDHITVDPAGDVYLADFYGGEIQELAAGSDSPVVLPFSGLEFPFKAGVDAAGDVFALSDISSEVYELPAGASSATLLPLNGAPTPEYMAVDPAGDIFLGSGRGNQIVEYPAGSDSSTTLPFSGIEYAGPMAVDAAGDVYVADTFHDRIVALEVAAPSAPVVTAAPGSGQVTLSWPAVPAGELTGYEVYEGTSPGGESATPVNPSPLPSDATGTTVTGLANGSTYYFTVVATNDIGTSPSIEVSVTPVPGPPVSLTLDGPSSVVAGTQAAYSVTGTDAEGNPTGDETGASTFAIAPDPGRGGSLQGAECVGASCSATVAGTYTVFAATGAASGQASLTVTAAAASSVTATSGGGQRTPAGTAFSDPLVATVTDQYGNPVSLSAVTYTVTRGHATFANSAATIVAVSNAGGLVAETLTAGGVPGPVTVTASIGGAAVATFDLTVTADAWTGPASSGSPRVAPGGAAGFYLGLVGGSGNHWRLFVTQTVHRPVADYTGVLTVPQGRFSKVSGLQLEAGDSFQLSANGRSISFAFADAGYLDGLAFTTPDAAASLTLALSVDGIAATTGQVYLGPGDATPSIAGPLVISR